MRKPLHHRKTHPSASTLTQTHTHTSAARRTIDLVEIDIPVRQSRILERLGNRKRRSDTHHVHFHARQPDRHKLAQHGEAEPLGDASSREQDGRGAIGDLRGVAGVRGAVRAERGLELGEGFGRDVFTDAVVRVDDDAALLARLGVHVVDLDGNNFALEEAGLVGLESLLVRVGRKGILFLS